MKMNNKIICFLLLLTCHGSFAQRQLFQYERPLSEPTDQWHAIVLPQDVFGKVSADLKDLRIYGLSETGDTIEAPYLLNIERETRSKKDVNFKIINRTKRNRSYYFTFKNDGVEDVNMIQLSFKNKNFDWKVQLEGSQDQRQWYTITDDYRILSIKNSATDYQFTDINFESVQYKYFRLKIDSKKRPELQSASLNKETISGGRYARYEKAASKKSLRAQTKTSVIDIDLGMKVPLNKLIIDIADTIDFYRPVSIKVLKDSVKTEKGWRFNYLTVARGTLNSVETNRFDFNTNIADKIRVEIGNNDNEPLVIQDIHVMGYVHELVARFTKPGSYALCYGNPKAVRPNYDIEHFRKNIPDNLKPLNLGKEIYVPLDAKKSGTPLFQNKLWLWVIMGAIILLMGWFSIKMISTKAQD